jgi:hypothetical protein
VTASNSEEILLSISKEIGRIVSACFHHFHYRSLKPGKLSYIKKYEVLGGREFSKFSDYLQKIPSMLFLSNFFFLRPFLKLFLVFVPIFGETFTAPEGRKEFADRKIQIKDFAISENFPFLDKIRVTELAPKIFGFSKLLRSESLRTSFPNLKF